VPYEQNTCSKIALGYVRTLTQRKELPLLRDHLLRLDSEELAKLEITAPFVAARTVKNLNGAYWTLLFSSMVGPSRGRQRFPHRERSTRVCCKATTGGASNVIGGGT
jgi:hypothetical protein